VAAPEGDGEDFFGEPAVEQAQLGFVGDVFEVVIDDGDVADTVVDSAAGKFDGELGTFAEVEDAGKFRAATAKGVAEDIADFSAFVAREANFTAGGELEAEVAEGGGGCESFGGAILVRDAVPSMKQSAGKPR